MNEADRYRTLASSLSDVIDGVPDDGWSGASPCEGWTARDVVGHVVDSSEMFLGFIGQEPPARPSVEDDPAGAFAAATGAVQAGLDDPATAAQTYDGLFGPTTFAQSVDGFLAADLVIHRWDLARATGQDDTLPIEEVRRLHEQLLPMDDKMRGPGVFGPKIDPPADADEQTKLLCFLGRRV